MVSNFLGVNTPENDWSDTDALTKKIQKDLDDAAAIIDSASPVSPTPNSGNIPQSSVPPASNSSVENATSAPVTTANELATQPTTTEASSTSPFPATVPTSTTVSQPDTLAPVTNKTEGSYQASKIEGKQENKDN